MSTTDPESLTNFDTPLGTALAIVETTLALGIAYRTVIHLLVYNAARGPGAGDEDAVAGIESRFGVHVDEEIPVDVEMTARCCSLLFAIGCWFAFAPWLTDDAALQAVAAGNWLVLAADPLTGVYARLRH